jgi:hypothetical protein
VDRQGRSEALRSPWVTSIWGKRGGRLLFGDAVVVALFFTLTLFLTAQTKAVREEAGMIEVKVGGVQALLVDREEQGVREVTGPLGVTKLEFSKGRVRVLSSPCPLKIGVRAGWIERPGELLVCLPNEVVVRISGRRAGDPDAVSR